jgi:hypothetical protein
MTSHHCTCPTNKILFALNGRHHHIVSCLIHIGIAALIYMSLVSCGAVALALPQAVDTTPDALSLTSTPDYPAALLYPQPTAMQPTGKRSITAPTDTPTDSATPHVRLALGDAAVNVRRGPSTTFGVLVILVGGESVPITGRSLDGKWWRVEYRGQSGWTNVAVSPVTGDTTNVRTVETALIPPPAVENEPQVTASPASATPTPQAPQTQAIVLTSTPTGCVRAVGGAICNDQTITNITGATACTDHGGVKALLWLVCQ